MSNHQSEIFDQSEYIRISKRIDTKFQIQQIRWSPNGQYLAYSTSEKLVLLNSDTYQPIWEFKGKNGASEIAWSPNSQYLAVDTDENNIAIIETETRQKIRELSIEGAHALLCLNWSPDGHKIASGSGDNVLRIWDIKTGEHTRHHEHKRDVTSVCWSPDGNKILTGSDDSRIFMWDTTTGETLAKYTEHIASVKRVMWLPDGERFISASDDNTIRIWSLDSTYSQFFIDDIFNGFMNIQISHDGWFIAAKEKEGNIHLFLADSNERLVTLKHETENQKYKSYSSALTFHPYKSLLAVPGKDNLGIRIWSYDVDSLLNKPGQSKAQWYSNAKVVLMGESGVGKSGLSLVLTGHPFEATDSTHGRKIGVLQNEDIETADGSKITREVMLWDLAGQSDYRLIHQLHLQNIDVALVVCDTRDRADPFKGVRYWSRALDMATLVEQGNTETAKRILVIARIDRSHIGVSKDRIQEVVDELGFDGFVETSAREGRGIEELQQKVLSLIAWDQISTVSSTEVFQYVKRFILKIKRETIYIISQEHLFERFVDEPNFHLDLEKELLAQQFNHSILQLESQGLVRHLGFGDIILLRPEILDSYASAIILAASKEPDDMGSILESKVRLGDFSMPADERIGQRHPERLLLLSTIINLFEREIVLREKTPLGELLVFPSQFAVEMPALPDRPTEEVIYIFNGVTVYVYTTLVVRLTLSGLVEKNKLWKNAALFSSKDGKGELGILLTNDQEKIGKLSIFFLRDVSDQDKNLFEEFVRNHLKAHSTKNQIIRRRIFVCSECETPITDDQATRRRERGFDYINCGVCDNRVSLIGHEAEVIEFAEQEIVRKAAVLAELRTEEEINRTILQGKIYADEYDIFFSYADEDEELALAIAQTLADRGFLVWLRDWYLGEDLQWEPKPIHFNGEYEIPQGRSAAIFVRPSDNPLWERGELKILLSELQERNAPIIPIVSDWGESPTEIVLPRFLERREYINLEEITEDDIISSVTESLIEAIQHT